MRAGTVIDSHWSNQGYGLSVVVDHGDGMISLYAHLSFMSVKVGQTVSEETHLGQVKYTEWCTQNHLHLEIHQGGQAVNPFAYLSL